MVIEPFVRMGPPPRSLAAEANDCFMVWSQHGANRIQGCGASFRAQWQAPLGSFAANGGVVDLMSRLPTSRRPIMSQLNDGEPQLIKCCAVLAAVNTASRRLRRWPLASVDSRSARRTRRMQAGTKKRLSNRTKKLEEDKMEMMPTKNA